MLIRRCAWHREFHGYALIHGVASWRGLSIKFTDGVCRRCAARVRVEWHLGRAQADSPLRLGRFLSGGFRRAALGAGFAVLVAAVLQNGLITGALLREMPGRAPETTDIAAGVNVPVPAAAALAGLSSEAEPPRVSRHRPAPPLEVVVRYRAPRAFARPMPVSSGPSVPVSPHPVEAKRIEPSRPVQVATAAPIVTSVSRVRAVEDELMRVARGHSTTRLLLSPPEERPRHAGLMVQAP